MNGKNSISALQELMAARRHPLPVYTEESFGVGFRCLVRAANVTATGVGPTKKMAKHESAKNALDKLRNMAPSSQVFLLDKPSVLEGHFKNYVGELNEFASKKGLSYPDYDVLPVFTPNSFVCKCSFIGKEILGMSSNKKDAKQKSAQKMLELVKAMPPASLPVQTMTLENKKLDAVDTKKLFALYQNLSLKNHQPYETKSNNFEAIPGITVDDEDTVETLKLKLKQHGVSYTLKDIQIFPLLISSKITGTDLFFIGTGNGREEATRNVLQEMLMVVKTGCSLSTNDLISFD